MSTTETERTGEPPGGVPTGYSDIYQETEIGRHWADHDALQEQYREGGFFWNEYGPGYWFFTDGAMIREAFQRADVFTSSSTNPVDPNPPYLWIPQMLDPPLHTKWRQLLAPPFSPAAMAAIEDKVRSRCVEILDTFADRGSVDFVHEFGTVYPTTIFMEVMGLPLDGLRRFLHWEREILHLTAEEDPERTRGVAAMKEVMAYFDELAIERRTDPRDDLLTEALTWKIDGAPIPHNDFLSFCLLMFMAGMDTVTIQLTYMFWHLATHPEDRARILAEPELIPSAVEEMLRAYTFVPPSRKAGRDIDFHGCPVKAGDMVHLPLLCVTRDEKLFPNAKQVVLDRTPNNHVAFGAGPHRCLGAHLARRELRIALEEWHKRIRDYRIPEGHQPLERGVMFGPTELQLLW